MADGENGTTMTGGKNRSWFALTHRLIIVKGTGDGGRVQPSIMFAPVAHEPGRHPAVYVPGLIAAARPSWANTPNTANTANNAAPQGPDNEQRYFACYWYMLNPDAYPECGGHRVTSIKALKDHCEKVHSNKHKEHSCRRCLTLFRTPEKRDEHASFCACEKKPPRDWVEYADGDERQLLESSPKLGAVERWYAVWGQLFPGAEPPESPYLLPGLAEGDGLYIKRRGPALMEALLSMLEDIDAHLSIRQRQYFKVNGLALMHRVPVPEARYPAFPPTPFGGAVARAPARLLPSVHGLVGAQFGGPLDGVALAHTRIQPFLPREPTAYPGSRETPGNSEPPGEPVAARYSPLGHSSNRPLSPISHFLAHDTDYYSHGGRSETVDEPSVTDQSQPLVDGPGQEFGFQGGGASDYEMVDDYVEQF